MKSQPLAYNKDNQEDKEPLFDNVDTIKSCLTALLGIIEEFEVNEETMLQHAQEGYSTATDLADYLVSKICGCAVTFLRLLQHILLIDFDLCDYSQKCG